MCPDDERQEGDTCGGQYHRGITEQRLAREGRDDRRDHTERRQDHDIDLGVPEEPEEVLEQHRITAAGGIKKGSAKMTVGQQHGHRPGKHWHHGNQEEGGDHPGPHEQGHLHQGHARCTHIEDRDDDIDSAEHR